jgi:hypothetical protein
MKRRLLVVPLLSLLTLVLTESSRLSAHPPGGLRGGVAKRPIVDLPRPPKYPTLAWELYDVPANWAYWYPDGGYTLYPGEAGSGGSAASDYSAPAWVLPPNVHAQSVLHKMQQLGIPNLPPETLYLHRNPRIADGLKLPTPKDWVPKDEKSLPPPKAEDR